MSEREKKLVMLFGLAAFVLLNVFAIKTFKDYKKKLSGRLADAESKVQVATAYSTKYDTVVDEMDWLTDNLPDPKVGQSVQSQLEQYASGQAAAAQLEVKRKKILENDQTGTRFHRARVEYEVTGTEASLYRWLSKLQIPNKFSAVTSLRLSPNTADDTKIDCKVTAEQWYRPLSGDAAETPEPTAPDAGPTPSPLPPGLPGNPESAAQQ